MRFLKLASAALALTLAAASFTTSAEAKHRHHRHHGGQVAAATIFGLAAGAILGSTLSQPRYHYYEPAPVFIAPPPPPVRYYESAPVYYGPPEPWTREWYAYCRARYVSFDDETGFFYGYDQRYHFCR